MADQDVDLATAAHQVLVAWDTSFAELGEAIRELGQSLSDWLEVNDLRQCDNCSRITQAGDSPDWVNGMCEDCDPSLLDPCNCQLDDAAVDAE